MLRRDIGKAIAPQFSKVRYDDEDIDDDKDYDREPYLTKKEGTGQW